MPTPTNNLPVRVLDELEQCLVDLAAAHAELGEALDHQHEAMRRFDTAQMSRLARRQETTHRRILRLEAQRRRLASTAARAAGLAVDAPLTAIADAWPPRRERLLALRADLRRASADASERGQRCQRIAGSVLAHLNGALRLLTRSGLYQSGGTFTLPPPARRVELVG